MRGIIWKINELLLGTTSKGSNECCRNILIKILDFLLQGWCELKMSSHSVSFFEKKFFFSPNYQISYLDDSTQFQSYLRTGLFIFYSIVAKLFYTQTQQ